MGWVDDRDRNLGLMQSSHQVAFVTAGRFADDVCAGEGLEFIAQCGARRRGIFQLRLAALHMHLECGLSDINSDIDSSV